MIIGYLDPWGSGRTKGMSDARVVLMVCTKSFGSITSSDGQAGAQVLVGVVQALVVKVNFDLLHGVEKSKFGFLRKVSRSNLPNRIARCGTFGV